MKADSIHVQRIVLLILLLLVTLSFFHSPGTGDVKFWIQWIKAFDIHGPFVGFEEVQWDYPPFVSIILFGIAKTAHLFSIDYFTSLKLFLTIFLFATSFMFWIWTRDFFITAILHFSLLLNTMLLVYIDIFFAPILILSFWAIKKRKMITFTIFYLIACLIKWQPIIISPFILVYILNIQKISDWKEIDCKGIILNVMLPLSLIALITLLLYKMAFLKSFASAATTPYFSGTALNFGWIMTYFLQLFYPDIFGHLVEGQAGYLITTSLKVLIIPKILFVFFYSVTLVTFFTKEKSFENVIHYSLIGYMAYFIFNTGVHENHLFIANILAVVLIYLNREHLMISVFIIIISNMNLIIFYGLSGKGLGFSRVVGIDLTLILSLLNVVFFLLIWSTTCLKLKRIASESGHG